MKEKWKEWPSRFTVYDMLCTSESLYITCSIQFTSQKNRSQPFLELWQQTTQTPSTGLRHPSFFGARWRKAMLGVCKQPSTHSVGLTNGWQRTKLHVLIISSSGWRFYPQSFPVTAPALMSSSFNRLSSPATGRTQLHVVPLPIRH